MRRAVEEEETPDGPGEHEVEAVEVVEAGVREEEGHDPEQRHVQTGRRIWCSVLRLRCFALHRETRGPEARDESCRLQVRQDRLTGGTGGTGAQDRPRWSHRRRASDTRERD